MHVDAQSKIQIALLLTKIRLGKIKSKENLASLINALNLGLALLWKRMWRLVKSRSICFKYYRYYCTNQISKTFNLMIRSLLLFHDNQKGKQSQILPYPYRFTKNVKIVQWNDFVFPLCFTSESLSKTVILPYLGDKQYEFLKMYIFILF